MSTLYYRWVRGDMIETYKILSGKYDTNVVPNLKTTGIQATRGMIWEFSKLVLNMTCASFIMRPSSQEGAAYCVALCLSVCLSVRLSVRPVIVSEHHVAPPSELQWHTYMYFSARAEGIRTFRHALRAAYRTAISAAQILVLLTE